jgi:hypothetical protein
VSPLIVLIFSSASILFRVAKTIEQKWLRLNLKFLLISKQYCVKICGDVYAFFVLRHLTASVIGMRLF